MACGTLVSQSEIEPTPPALGLRSFNHWTAREVPEIGHRRVLSKGVI